MRSQAAACARKVREPQLKSCCEGWHAACKSLILNGMRAVWVRGLALLAALLLALPLAAISRNQYFCHMLERVTLGGCCCHARHAEEAEQVEAGHAEIKASDCCAPIESKSQPVAAPADLSSRTLDSALAYVEPTEWLLEAPVVHLAAFEPRQARAPPPTRLKLFLKHCSLLT